MRYPFAMEAGVFHTTYAEEIVLHSTFLAKLRLWGIIAFLFLLPWLVPTVWVGRLDLILVFLPAALGQQILTGYTGQISVGQAAFAAVGAYTSGLLTVRLNVPFELALPAAGLTAALVGAFFGIPSLRLKGLYLAMATIAAQVIIEYTLNHWDSLTRGTRGLNLDHASILGYKLDTPLKFYYLGLVLALLLGAFAVNLFRTRVGRALIAIRDRDIAAEIIGVDLFRYKIMAFGLSAFYAGITGSLWGHYTGVIFPDHFDMGLSIQILAMVLIGGLGSVMGAVYGAAFMQLLPIFLRESLSLLAGFAPSLQAMFQALREVVFGAAVILFLIFEPEGLAKLWKNIKDYFKVWPFSY